MFIIFKLLKGYDGISSKILIQLSKCYRLNGYVEMYGKQIIERISKYIVQLYSENPKENMTELELIQENLL